ncbi:hypothetical protein E1A91_A07G242300v1 [Gossypium mustelinum]|uniref:Homeobox-leucine zipper protein n=1 Tax=Gossypium mustelinum TaxID=34275 RepID=A0A5D2YP11_GOSMU|nr:hypothetical protein E1A91_A07G242300v1 [Gossypium mustelinum]
MAFPPHAFMFQTLHEDQNHFPSPYSLLPCPPQLFHGGVGKSHQEVHGHGDDDEYSDDDGSHGGEKKKRLNMDQVKALEKSFELGNKLEPGRKLQLAKDLGLKPRQIAIWFQNRRARWKNKQLEKDYDALKKLYQTAKSDNDALQAQNKKLTAQLLSLKTKDSNETRIKNENEGSWCSNGSENNYDMNLAIRPATTMTQLLHGSSKPSLHCLKLDQVVHQDQSLACHMFNQDGDEQQGFWPWADQSIKFPLN